MRTSIDLSRAMLTIATIFALGSLACASDPEQTAEEQLGPMAGELANAPDWVTRGCGAFWGDDQPSKLCGVGSAGGSRNHSLMVTAAQGRGRTAIARSLDLHVKAMLKDYQATTTGGEEYGTNAADEQHIVDVSKQITDIELVGVEQRDLWISPSGQVYVLMVYDAEKFSTAVSSMKNLSEEIRQAVIERADASFQELDEEIEKER
jgi:hypothetical protein